jgi:hypothetical protein
VTRVLVPSPPVRADARQRAGPSPQGAPEKPAPAAARRAGAPPAVLPRSGHDFSRITTHPRPGGASRLTIGPADDAFEREADRLAAKVAGTSLPPSPAGEDEGGGGKGGRAGTRVQASRLAGGAGAEVAPPIVHDVLRASGQPLDAATRAFVEPRFGHDFGRVRVHADAHAARAASAVGARAFTVGHDLVFGAGEYAPHGERGRRLLAHELAHTLQQEGAGQGVLQRTPCIDERGRGPFDVAVIGAPAPAEISASHPYQFMNAALFHGVGRNTVWIVEQTGYVAGGVGTGHIESSVAAGCLIWLTPTDSLPAILNREFPNGSIASATVYSHGLAGQVTLRYGWSGQGLPNYGLSMSQLRTLSPSRFTTDAEIRFDSCNTGTTVDEGNLAQEAAYYSGRSVRAWTGRTSYSEVNDGQDDGDVAVQGSQVYRNSMDWTELGSRIRGRTPVLTTFSPPGPRVGGFTSSFEITTRLPETQHFTVPEGGMVVVKCMNGTYVRPNRDPVDSDRIGIHLLQSGTVYDSRMGHESLAVGQTDIAIFPRLAAGEYYLEITFESAPVSPYETLESDIVVDVHERL